MLGQLKPRQIVRQFPESHKMWPRNRFRQLKENALAQQVVTVRWLLTSPRQTITESADCACLGFHPRSCSSVKRACKPDRSQLFCWKSPTHIASLSHRSRFFPRRVHVECLHSWVLSASGNPWSFLIARFRSGHVPTCDRFPLLSKGT